MNSRIICNRLFMIMKRLYCFAISMALFDAMASWGSETGGMPIAKSSSSVAEYEIIQMSGETDNLMDILTDGSQDREADAVLHSLRGESGDLAKLRKMQEKEFMNITGVKEKDINGYESGLGISLRLYEKENEENDAPASLVIFFHGGGWVTGSLESGREFCRSLVARGNIKVLTIDFPLVPETSPKKIHEISSRAIDYAIKNASKWNCDGDDVTLCGEDSGGEIILGALRNMTERNDISSIKKLILFYPLARPEKGADPSIKKEFARGYGFDKRLYEALTEAYLESEEKNDGKVDEESFSEDIQMKGLIIYAGKDIACIQSEEIADSLIEKGMEIETIEFSEALHYFISKKGQPTAFNKAVDFTINFIESN